MGSSLGQCMSSLGLGRGTHDECQGKEIFGASREGKAMPGCTSHLKHSFLTTHLNFAFSPISIERQSLPIISLALIMSLNPLFPQMPNSRGWQV